MNFSFFVPTRIMFGKGELNNLHKQDLPGKKALVVISSGKSTKANGYLDKLYKQLDLKGISYTLFDKISPNPTKSQVMDGASLSKETGCDFVIGLGGGSSIDAAKSISVMATNEGDYWDYIDGGSGKNQPVKNDPLPLVAITTTAGTGTEADPWTVITKEDTNEKIGFGYDKMFPVLSIVDPELMMTVPKEYTAYQGFDALFHSTEGYLNKNANPMSDMFALKAIELVSQNLAKAYAYGSDEDARANIALGNTLSGIVECTSSCISEHSLEHALSAYYPSLPHGAGLIMISKAYYKFFAKKHVCDEKMINMARAMGCKNATDSMDFINMLEKLQIACNVNNLKMSDYGIRREDLYIYAKNAFNTMGGLFERDPYPLTIDDCVYIYEKSYK
jgi:alcohol dehydrogenase